MRASRPRPAGLEFLDDALVIFLGTLEHFDAGLALLEQVGDRGQLGFRGFSVAVRHAGGFLARRAFDDGLFQLLVDRGGVPVGAVKGFAGFTELGFEARPGAGVLVARGRYLVPRPFERLVRLAGLGQLTAGGLAAIDGCLQLAAQRVGLALCLLQRRGQRHLLLHHGLEFPAQAVGSLLRLVGDLLGSEVRRGERSFRQRAARSAVSFAARSRKSIKRLRWKGGPDLASSRPAARQPQRKHLRAVCDSHTNNFAARLTVL
jgi:hypothetical protein